ncbi:hypothetical protein C4565_08555 [Candidatus Parcubacteria bacterium]|jgi:putative transposon-encoded protein|nr:MAG: hypothetical protein C4565_08555 [Candidatus Parcubacteria bacterium]
MIVITGAPLLPFIPIDLRNELVSVVLNVVEEKNGKFIVRAEDIISGLKKLKRNYAVYYYEKVIDFFGSNGLISIPKEMATHLV